MQNKKRVVVGLSGGVDSSVAAALLLEQGYDVVGVFALGWTGTREFPCNWQSEERDARAAVDTLGIPFHTINLSEEYEKLVIDEFLAAYQHNETPNPDVLCNSEIKFKALWEALRQFEPDYFATGHYAKIEKRNGNYEILKGSDSNKDQSYFLWRIDKKMLPKILFPLGDLEKPKVRELAKKFGLPTALKKDSQGVCFIGPLKVRAFLESRLQVEPGEVVLTDGRVVARHEGTPLYTIGQRLGAGSVSWTGDVPPLFVLAKDQKNNRLIVGSDEQLFSTTFTIGRCNWLVDENQLPARALVKIRYRSEDIAATVHRSDQDFQVELLEKARAITPGQSAVFYDEHGVLLGGGVIKDVATITGLLASF